MGLLKGNCRVLMLCLIFSVSAAAASEAACMSCLSHTGSSYTELACEGDSKFDVIRKCGQFDYIEENEEIISGGTDTRRKHGDTRSFFGAVTERVETAYYNCGQGRFIKVLVFRNGILVSVTDGDRGSGEQKCW
jgi:hypothetical protein